MKNVFLVLTFIAMSLVSTVVESSELEMCFVTDHSVSSNLTFIDLHSNDCSQNDCHDSNCIGLAHFGHGFYFSSMPYKHQPSLYFTFKEVSFTYLHHKSLIVLDEIFRPPLLS